MSSEALGRNKADWLFYQLLGVRISIAQNSITIECITHFRNSITHVLGRVCVTLEWAYFRYSISLFYNPWQTWI